MVKRYAFNLKNWFRACLILSGIFSFTNILQAQIAPAKQWDKTIGGTGSEGSAYVKQTADGGYILGGNSWSDQNGDKTDRHNGWGDFWLVKLDSTGKKQWDRTFGNFDTDYLQDVLELPDGGFILAGTTTYGRDENPSQPGKRFNNFWLIRVNQQGTKMWEKTFGGNGFDDLGALSLSADGGFLLGGASQSDISGDKTEDNDGPEFSYDAWIIKTDANGNKLWDKSFGGAGEEGVASIQQTPDGGYLLGCSSSSNSNPDKSQDSRGETDLWVLKINALGTKIWDKTIGGAGQERLTVLRLTTNGDIYLGATSGSGKSGDKTSAQIGGDDFWVIKLDSLGNHIWDKTLGGTGTDRLFALELTPGGGLICGGESYSNLSADKTQKNRGNSDMWLVKLDASGNKIWDKTMGGDGYDYLSSLQLTSDQGLILAGRSNSLSNTDKSQDPKTLADRYGQYDHWVIKLAPEIKKETLESSLAFSVAPNPVLHKFRLYFNDVASAVVDISVYNHLGREVFRQEVQVMKNKISEELTLPVTRGIYYLQVRSGENVISQKLLLH